MSMKQFSLEIVMFIVVSFLYFSIAKANEELAKKCKSITEENKLFCNNLITKTQYRVEAVVSLFDNNNQTSNNHKGDLFSFHLPINTCKDENCEFCCLSTNRCGSKIQCENSQYYRRIVNYAFFGFCFVLFLTVMIKFAQTDSYPDQEREDKISLTDLNELEVIFRAFKNHKANIQSSHHSNEKQVK